MASKKIKFDVTVDSQNREKVIRCWTLRDAKIVAMDMLLQYGMDTVRIIKRPGLYVHLTIYGYAKDESIIVSIDEREP